MQQKRLFAMGLLMTAGVLAAGLARAQGADVVLALQGGSRTTPLARLIGGQWVDAGACIDRRAADARARLTATGGGRIAGVEALGPGSDAWLRLRPTILRIAGEREREQRLAAAGASTPTVVEWMYAAAGTDGRIYYFETSRRVGSAGDVDDDTDPPGTVRIAVAGFLHDGAAGLTLLGAKSELRWEQDGLPAGPARPDLTPLGVLVRSGDPIWVMQGHSGAATWFTLYATGARGTRMLLTTARTRC